MPYGLFKPSNPVMVDNPSADEMPSSQGISRMFSLDSSAMPNEQPGQAQPTRFREATPPASAYWGGQTATVFLLAVEEARQNTDRSAQ